MPNSSMKSEPRIRLLCTEQTYPQDSTWGELQGSIDIWCPLFAFFDRSSAAKVLKQGNQLWTYTALCQKAPTYHPEFQKVGGLSTFFWQIDFPSLNFRLPFWVIWEDQIKGLLYWSMVHWNDPVRDVWTDPAFRNRYNGEGYFFYPGTEAGIAGPVASIRLKVLQRRDRRFGVFETPGRTGRARVRRCPGFKDRRLLVEME